MLRGGKSRFGRIWAKVYFFNDTSTQDVVSWQVLFLDPFLPHRLAKQLFISPVCNQVI